MYGRALKANPKAVDNVEEFKKTVDSFTAPNPYMKGDAKLKYVGMTSFGQKRQLSVPPQQGLDPELRDGGLLIELRLLEAGLQGWQAAGGEVTDAAEPSHFQSNFALGPELRRGRHPFGALGHFDPGYRAFIDRFEGRMINIHPSLLPKYPGLRTHARAIEAGDEEAGATVHEVTSDLDSGPILGQARVPVEPGDTPETLAARVLEREHQLYPLILRRFAAGARECFDI